MDLLVKPDENRLYLGTSSYICALGRSGCLPAMEKTEGDGATPIGRWPLRRVFYRPDRTAPPQTSLPVIALSPDDGWCDAPLDPLYNKRVRLPYPASHEKLWKDEHVYDVIVEIGHNDDPVVPHRGSAVFMHIARPGFTPTEGCVALRQEDLLTLLAAITPDSHIEIKSD